MQQTKFRKFKCEIHAPHILGISRKVEVFKSTKGLGDRYHKLRFKSYNSMSMEMELLCFSIEGVGSLNFFQDYQDYEDFQGPSILVFSIFCD